MVEGNFTVSSHAISKPPCTNGDRLYLGDVKIALADAPLSIKNLVIQNTVFGFAKINSRENFVSTKSAKINSRENFPERKPRNREN